MFNVNSIREIRKRDRRLAGLFVGTVEVLEKYDGSQFNFGRSQGSVQYWSHHKDISNGAHSKEFDAAVGTIIPNECLIPEGAKFHCEYFRAPRQNRLEYGRVPKGHLILWGVEYEEFNAASYMDMEKIRAIWARTFDIEPAKVLYKGVVPDIVAPDEWLKTEFIGQPSSLGKANIEGVVVNNYALEDTENGRKYLCGKFVSDEFREVAGIPIPKANIETQIIALGDNYNTDSRKLKAIQHLRDKGKFTGNPSDIGLFVKEFLADIWTEEGPEIRKQLMELVEKPFQRQLCIGLADWFKGHAADETLKTELAKL